MENAKLLQTVREMRDTLSKSALEVVLVDEIADVERDIREMHTHRQKLHEKLNSLNQEKIDMQNALVQQQRVIDGAENEILILAQKKEDLTNMQKLGNTASKEVKTPSDRKPMLMKEKIELDTVIHQMEVRFAESKNSGTVEASELEYLDSILQVVKGRREKIVAEIDGKAASGAVPEEKQQRVDELKSLQASQEKELIELRKRVQEKEAARAAAAAAAEGAGD